MSVMMASSKIEGKVLITIVLQQVALTAFYNTATQGFATTFFNQTITIVEQPRLIDLELIFLWLLLLSLLGGGGESDGTLLNLTCTKISQSPSSEH